MSCCCDPEDDPEQLLLQDRSRSKRDRNVTERDMGRVTSYGEYQEILGSIGDEQKSPATRKSIYCGYGFAVVGTVTLATSLACTEVMGVSVPYSELSGLRFTAQLINISPLLIGCDNCDITVEKDMIGWLALSIVLLIVNNYSYYGTVYYLPVDVSSGIICCLVLVFNYIIKCIVDKTVKWYEITAFVLSVLGVILVTQPAFIFQQLFSEHLVHVANHTYENTTLRLYCGTSHDLYRYSLANSTSHDMPFGSSNIRQVEEGMVDLVGYLFCLVAAVTSTAYMQIIKWRLSGLNIFVFNFWACLCGMGVSFITMAITESPLFPTTAICVAFVIVHCLSAGSHTITVYRAFQLLDPVLSSLILTLRIVFIIIYQYTILSWFRLATAHVIILEIIGSILICVGAIFVGVYLLIRIRREKAAEKRRQEEAEKILVGEIDPDFEIMNIITY